MEEKLKKKRTRKVVLILILILAIAGSIYEIAGSGHEDNIGEGMAVTMEIACAGYEGENVPDGGVILPKQEVSCSKNATAYDVLYSTCRDKDIQLETLVNTGSDSRYVEGIAGIYEFDGGAESGWVFSVNGKRPEKSCSEVELNDGDEITWSFVLKRGDE